MDTTFNLDEKVSARMDAVHANLALLYTDPDNHIIDLYYSEVMRKYFDNAGYRTRKEYLPLTVAREPIAKAAYEWFKNKGILARPLEGFRLELGSITE